MAYKSSYSKEAFDKALSAVKRRTMSIRQASAEYGVPRSTLSDHKLKVPSSGARGRKRELSDVEESALVGYVTYMANQGIPCSRAIIRTKVIEMLEKSGAFLCIFDFRKCARVGTHVWMPVVLFTLGLIITSSHLSISVVMRSKVNRLRSNI